MKSTGQPRFRSGRHHTELAWCLADRWSEKNCPGGEPRQTGSGGNVLTLLLWLALKGATLAALIAVLKR